MKNIHLDMVRVTEAAAVAAAYHVGRGDKIAADRAATEAMRDRLNKIDFGGLIVIGEGKKDNAPGLFVGEQVGRWKREDILIPEDFCDIAVDPIEGTTPTAKGGYEAMSVIALGGAGSLFSTETYYMNKLAVGSHLAKCDIRLSHSLGVIVEKIQRATTKPLDMITFCVLDRPRHAQLISEIRSIGCRIRLIGDCDVSGAIATCVPNSGIDICMGIGGSPEGVISAVALKCMRGYFEGMLCDPEGRPTDGKVYTMNELAKGDVVFCGTGITPGSILQGVRYTGNKIITHSMLITNIVDDDETVRFIETHHRQ